MDAVESKLSGIGAESYTVGSTEFQMGYATSRQTAVCLDAGSSTQRSYLRQISAAYVRASPAAAREPPRPLGQRPRGAAGRRAPAIASETTATTVRPRAHRPRFLRCLHHRISTGYW
ncbi:L-rhamnose isomerase [Shigella flexneri]